MVTLPRNNEGRISGPAVENALTALDAKADAAGAVAAAGVPKLVGGLRIPGEIVAEDYGVYPSDYSKYPGDAEHAYRIQTMLQDAQAAHRSIRLGEGSYKFFAMSNWPDLVGLRGQSRSATKIVFAPAASGDLWAMPLSAANSAQSPPMFSDFAVDFNKSAQGAGVRGIVVKTPTPGSGLSAYCRSPIFREIELLNAKGDALTFELGRNLVDIDGLRMYGGDADGLVIDGSMDCKIFRADVGAFVNGTGLNVKRGSGVYGNLCHFYMSLINFQMSHNAADFQMIRCDFDRALTNAAVVRGVSGGKTTAGLFIGCTFVMSSSSAPGTYSEVLVQGARALQFVGCETPYYGSPLHTSVSKYFLEFASYGTNPDSSSNDPVPAIVNGILYDPAIETTLWPSGFTNMPAMITGSGWSRRTGLAFPSSTSVALKAGDVNVVVCNSSYWSTNYPGYFNNAPVVIQKTSAATDEKKSRLTTSNHNGREVVGIALGNDAETAATLAFGVKRVGYTFSTLYSGLLPTSATGLASGDYWRDAAAGNVVKQVP